MYDLEQHAYDRIAETIDIKGFQDPDDVLRAIDDLEEDFDAESYCPYYSQQDEVIRDYERDFGEEAEDICSGTEYKASDWQQAKTAYAYAIAYCAFTSYFYRAKEAIKESIEEFVDDVNRELEPTDEVQIQITTRCTYGWAAHDRELSDGTMIFESRQLDGSNGMERNINGIWVSTCFEPKKESNAE